MDVLLTLAVLTLLAVISGLQMCSVGTDNSSMQISLYVSNTPINAGGGMCSCRLTVSQTTQVDMFIVSWGSQCDTYMTIPMWSASIQCTNGVVQAPPVPTQTINTGEEIWILVVAKKPGAKGLSGQLQFKVKQPSGLHMCSLKTETSSTQILLGVSTTQINKGGGMCSCRLTVSQTTLVDMFAVNWTKQCDSYLTVPKWTTSTKCTNGVVQDPPSQTHTVTTGEEILILVVATKPEARKLSGRLQFKVKQPSAELTIECFEPNTNSSTTTKTTTSTVPTTTTVTSMKTTSTRLTTSTEKPSVTSTDSTLQGQTTSATGDTSTTSSAEVTSGSSATSTGSTQASPTPTQSVRTGNTNVASVAGGIGGGLLLILIIVIAVTCYRRKQDNDPRILEDIPSTNKHSGYVNHSYENEERGNFLYQSCGVYDKQPEEQALGKEEDNIQKQESSPVSGAPPGEGSDGMKHPDADADPGPAPVSNDVSDMYAAVDEVQAGNPVLVDNDMYATADGIAKEQPSGLNSTDGLYAVVNNPDEPPTATQEPESQDGIVSPSGDIYAVVNKSKPGEQPSETDEPGSQDGIVSPSGDIYAVVNKSKSVEDSATDDVYAVVDKSRKHGSMDQDGSGKEGSLTADDQEAALCMMNSALEEGLDETAPPASPTIQSTDL